MWWKTHWDCCFLHHYVVITVTGKSQKIWNNFQFTNFFIKSKVQKLLVLIKLCEQLKKKLKCSLKNSWHVVRMVWSVFKSPPWVTEAETFWSLGGRICNLRRRLHLQISRLCFHVAAWLAKPDEGWANDGLCRMLQWHGDTKLWPLLGSLLIIPKGTVVLGSPNRGKADMKSCRASPLAAAPPAAPMLPASITGGREISSWKRKTTCQLGPDNLCLAPE